MQMRTYSRRLVHLLDLKPGDVVIEDVAHALALVNRYGGHTPEPYSVAQHSVYVAQLLPPWLRLHGLLHDAAEAYVGDFITPIKEHMPGFHGLEGLVMEEIRKAFGLHDLHPADAKLIHDVDKGVGLFEQRDFFAQPLPPDMTSPPEIRPWPWQVAERRFLRAFDLYTGKNPAPEPDPTGEYLAAALRSSPC